MTYRDGHFRPKQGVNIFFNDGGLGDHLARMVAIKYIKETWKHVEMNVIVPDFFQDLAKNLVPGIVVGKFSDGPKYWANGLPAIQTKGMVDAMRTHLVDNAFTVFANKQVEDKDKNYCKLNTKNIDITKFNLPEKYVVVTTGFTAEVREMKASVVNEVASYIKSKGYEVVFLGSKAASTGLDSQKILVGNFNTEIDFSVGIDLIDKTTLLQAGKIIGQAKSIVGVDNGLLHIAGCTDTYIIAAFTNVAPELRLPYRNNQLGWNCTAIVPEKSLKCRFCQSNWGFDLKTNFTKCYYKENKMDTTIKCVDSMTSSKFIEALEKVL